MNPEMILQTIEHNLLFGIAGAYGVILLLLALFLIVFFKMRNLGKKIRQIEEHEPEKIQISDPEEALSSLNKLEDRVSQTLQRVGVVRFNAFEDVGSELSFALAVLNDNGNGFVLSSLYGRSETRTFVKPVREGKSDYQLSGEEIAAIKKALDR